jgi:sugar phosphate isomerase/epimerase
MRTIKGPGIFLGQFAEDKKPYNNLKNICKWVSGMGFVGIQLPLWDKRFVDLELCAGSKTYAAEINGIASDVNLSIVDAGSFIQGQLMAVNPGYDKEFDAFVPDELKGNSQKRTEWAISQLKLSAIACRNLGIESCGVLSGSLMWQSVYPWPPYAGNYVSDGFKELARRWLPVLNCFDDQGIDVCFELHPTEDLHDGITFERFLTAVNNHNRAKILYDPSHLHLQNIDYLAFIEYYHDYIKMFHVKDAEFNRNGKSGVYGGYQEWIDRPGRFRSVGDGQIEFKNIFSKLSQYDYTGWAVLEWEDCLKNQVDGAKEGCEFIKKHIIKVTHKNFDKFMNLH